MVIGMYVLRMEMVEMRRRELCLCLCLGILINFFFLFYSASSNAEGDALNALKVALTDPNGVLQSWDPTLVNPCTWFNVTCNPDNSVTRVHLGNANLTGQLVTNLGQLPSLQYLELYSNNISGPIPFELGNLTNLVSLDLHLNKLDGPIPPTLGKLQKLRFLRLNNNTLSGGIPYSLTSITTLQVLDLSNNQLSGDVPVNGSFSLFTPISYNGNPKLHMPPTPPPPPIQPASGSSSEVKNKGDDKMKIGLYVSIGIGIYTGFWGFWATLAMKDNWRSSYFKFLDHKINKHFGKYRRNYHA